MKTIRMLVLAGLLVCAWGTVEAQQNLSVQLGNFRSYSVQNNILTIIAENANVLLTAYTPEIIRVRVVRISQSPDFSYAVIQDPQTTSMHVKENQQELVMQTERLRVVIQKDPILLQFSTQEGMLLNKDAPGFGVSWIGTEVTCYKSLMPDERFIGLGEKTGGLNRWGNAYENWNTDYYGYHTNTDPIYSSIPFYIGLHGTVAYGIFLDNTFKTVFNFGASNDQFPISPRRKRLFSVRLKEVPLRNSRIFSSSCIMLSF